MMPDMTLKDAIAAALIDAPAVTQHVAPTSIRAGSIRPEHVPAIILSPARVDILGHGSNGTIIAEISAMVHIWAVADSAIGPQIASAAMLALMDAPHMPPECAIDEWERPSIVWMRDPDPARSYTHGAISLRAAVRWREP